MQNNPIKPQNFSNSSFVRKKTYIHPRIATTKKLYFTNITICYITFDMTIALFSDSYLPTKSGIVTVVTQLREQLKAMGHRVILVTVETTDEYYSDDPDIYQVHSVPLGLGTDQFLGIPAMHPLISYLKSCNIDIIHCHTEFGIAKAGLRAAKILKVPAICTTHTMWTDFYKFYLPMGKWISPSIINGIMNRFYGKFYSLIGVSTKARNYFKQKDMIPNMPSVIIPNAIDKKRFQAEIISEERKKELKQKYGIKENEKILLFVGRIGQEKRVFELLDLCLKLLENRNDCKVLFVGNGPALSTLQKKMEDHKLKDKIIFTGFIEWTQVHEFYESSDIFITTSLSEMHSMTILEAQLSSLPIIARHDESYLDSIYHGQNGFLAENEEKMIDHINELLDDEEKRKAFGKRSLEIAQNFSIETHVKRTLFVYEEALKNYPNKFDDEDLNKRIQNI